MWREVLGCREVQGEVRGGVGSVFGSGGGEGRCGGELKGVEKCVAT